MKIKLTTPYADKMDKTTPWNEYPRPSMVRGSFLCLNGSWDFAIGDECAPADYSEKILVPFPPESALSGIERSIPEGSYIHYKRNFEIRDDFLSDKLILHFGAVDTVCEVFLNGALVANHEGGYLPFSADCTKFAKAGENELYIRVYDDISPLYPYGKQTKKRGGMWYTPVSGIWQTVWMEAVPEVHIEKIKITSTKDSVTISVTGGEDKKTVKIQETDEEIEFYGSEVTFTPRDIHLWTPETPFLYNFTLKSGKDCIGSYFALREIGISDFSGVKRLTLNGEPYLFNGLLDQGYFPDGIFLPATLKGYEDDILRAKAMGFNMLRKHIKVEPELFYNLCDRLGMVVFQDMVNNSNYSFLFDTALPTVGMKRFPDGILHRNEKSRSIFMQHMRDEIEHLYNFPSILYYTIFNEGWGQFCADEMYELAKSYDKTRIIDATSGWFIRKKSDVDSYHVYFKPLKIKKFGSRPLVISEFGGYSHRVTGHLFGEDNYGYKTFEENREYENALIKLYSDEVIPLIRRGASAFVYTQLTDVEDETNGLITYDRAIIKVNVERIHNLMKEAFHACILYNKEE